MLPAATHCREPSLLPSAQAIADESGLPFASRPTQAYTDVPAATLLFSCPLPVQGHDPVTGKCRPTATPHTHLLRRGLFRPTSNRPGRDAAL